MQERLTLPLGLVSKVMLEFVAFWPAVISPQAPPFANGLLAWVGRVVCGWWPEAKHTMRPDGVVVIAPSLDQHLRLRQIVEDFPIQQLFPELAVEALVVAVLPRRAGLDVERLRADSTRQPVPHRLCGALAAITSEPM